MMKLRIPGDANMKAHGLRAGTPFGLLALYRQRLRRLKARALESECAPRRSVPPVDPIWANIGV
jgi:hypothetical protein